MAKKILISIIILGVLAGVALAAAPYPVFYPLAGKVSAAEDGTKASGRTIRFYKTDPSAGVATAVISPDGSFTIDVFDIWPDKIEVGAKYKIDMRFVGEYGIATKEGTFISGQGYDEVPGGLLVLTAAVEPVVYGSISGTITDADTGDPIEEATVTDGTRTRETDSAGNYTLANVPAGVYTVEASLAEYEDATKSVELSAGDSKQVDFILVPLDEVVITQIQVTVTDAVSGGPVSGADVEVIGGEEAKTDAGGMCSFDVDPGTYKVKASKERYIPKTEEITVARGKTEQVAIAIKYSTPPTLRSVRFGNRLYQPGLVAKGQSFYVAPRPEITVTLTNEPESGIASGSISLVVDEGEPTSHRFEAEDFTVSGIKTQSIAGVDKISEMAVRFEVPEYAELEAEEEGEPHTFSFSVENDYGRVGTYVATVEVMAGPIRLIERPLTYPSPFSITRHGTVIIQYTLSADADIDIYLTDVGGRRIQKFSCNAGSEGGSAGLNKVSWGGMTAMGLPAGNAIYVGTIIARQEGRLLGKVKLTIVD